ncbi:hypothetical protein M3Y96_00726900 [Aphelenchoides besseyi]|nr:hypothetical protein M3Y96_00726900 [Aphelenchoides besseyi]
MLKLILLLGIPVVRGHITLTFPQALYPPLDFLDTARTSGVCGLPQSDRSQFTTLKIDTDYNITWRLQYPHQGGYRLKIIDYMGNDVEFLAPNKPVSDDPATENVFDGLDDQSAEWKSVRFQSVCPNCTLVLERQALEWGKQYKFRSCAQVHVVQSFPNDMLRCSNKGIWKDERCECRSGYNGEFCQYKGDCTVDEDCENDGKCLKDSITPNKYSCYCSYGYFGSKCQEKSVPSFSDDECFKHIDAKDPPASFKYGLFEERCFKKFDLDNNDFLYSRIVKDSLELIMDYETDSYVALGWRPANIPKTCRLFPDLGYGSVQSALDFPLHPMDCTDIVMASVVDGRVHIEDMYTRDRSTPINDEILDGEQSLTSVYGVEQNGRTIVMFRRGIREIEPSDHPLGPGKIVVIHAKGQHQNHYKHLTPSALEKNHTKNANFYKADQWRYHGSANRGVHSLQFVTGSDMQHFKSPLLMQHRKPNATTTENVLERPSNALREQVLPRPSIQNKDDGDATMLQNPETVTVTDVGTPRLTVEDANSSEKVEENENSSMNNKNEQNNANQGQLLSIHLIAIGLSIFSFF